MYYFFYILKLQLRDTEVASQVIATSAREGEGGPKKRGPGVLSDSV